MKLMKTKDLLGTLGLKKVNIIALSDQEGYPMPPLTYRVNVYINELYTQTQLLQGQWGQKPPLRRKGTCLSGTNSSEKFLTRDNNSIFCPAHSSLHAIFPWAIASNFLRGACYFCFLLVQLLPQMIDLTLQFVGKTSSPLTLFSSTSSNSEQKQCIK